MLASFALQTPSSASSTISDVRVISAGLRSVAFTCSSVRRLIDHTIATRSITLSAAVLLGGMPILLPPLSDRRSRASEQPAALVVISADFVCCPDELCYEIKMKDIPNVRLR